MCVPKNVDFVTEISIAYEIKRQFHETVLDRHLKRLKNGFISIFSWRSFREPIIYYLQVRAIKKDHQRVEISDSKNNSVSTVRPIFSTEWKEYSSLYIFVLKFPSFVTGSIPRNSFKKTVFLLLEFIR